MSEPVERSVTGDGVRLHARDWGSNSGGEAVLLVHGLASTSHIWDLVAPRLAAAGLRVVAYDQRGHGRSGKPSSGYGFGRTMADAAAVIRRLRLAPALVVGHSWGANVALELAIRRPRAVRGAVLIDGGFANLRDWMDWETARRDLSPPDLRGMRFEEFARRVRERLGEHVRDASAVEAMLGSIVRVDASGRIHPRLSRSNHLRILRALWEQDAVGLLRAVRVPSLVLAARSRGALDLSGFDREKERAARVVRSIGGPVRFEWIDGIHDVPLQRPAAVARRILRAAVDARTSVRDATG